MTGYSSQRLRPVVARRAARAIQKARTSAAGGHTQPAAVKVPLPGVTTSRATPVVAMTAAGTAAQRCGWLVAPGGEHREERPAGGQADQAGAGDARLGSAGEHDQDENEGVHQAAEHGGADRDGERDPAAGGRRGVCGDGAGAVAGRGGGGGRHVGLASGRWDGRAGWRYSFSVGAQDGGRPGLMTGFRACRCVVGVRLRRLSTGQDMAARRAATVATSGPRRRSSRRASNRV